ncbi:MAG: 2OG-Fe(II) oxygenase family protein [Gammaproteobacteria bacterium]|nr:2OG-Fe(II) oxygenase family protein [Gammaproteobacteria bacterium]
MKAIAVWPGDREAEVCGDPTIHKITFTDIQEYHPRLIAKILELEENHRLRKRNFRGDCGTKLHHLEKWASTEAELLTARAKALFRKVLACDQSVVDLSWANVYRHGDYCLPHSHLRSTASVVYCLDPGDEDPEDAQSGRLCFVDPRLRDCCKHQDGCMTAPFFPVMASGTMLIFPSQLVHTVNPYTGKRPRITLSWNINKDKLPGTPLPANAGNGTQD